MRRFQAVLQRKSLEITKIGKFSLFLLILILTILIYSNAQAKEALDEKTFFDELKNIDGNQKYNLCQRGELKQDQIKKNAVLDENKRLFYNLNLLMPESSKNIQVKDSAIIDQELKQDIALELQGTRMEPMIDFIAKKDRRIAALLVGIAKIESGYKHNYQFNFWGYAGGYYGFKNPEQAVNVVGKRLEELSDQGLDTPQKLVTTWKCGSSCASHPPGSVKRWVNTVSGPFTRIAMK
ncbi:MAG: hypothetical protein ABIC19_00525 [Patescibacteria group bacterium]|nr:hypothetical protein [Patescibacteria group bacterium]